MSTTLWIIIGVVVAFVLAYVLAMRNVFNQSRDAYKKVDYKKIRKWKKEDEEER